MLSVTELKDLKIQGWVSISHATVEEWTAEFLRKNPGTMTACPDMDQTGARAFRWFGTRGKIRYFLAFQMKVGVDVDPAEVLSGAGAYAPDPEHPVVHLAEDGTPDFATALASRQATQQQV